MCKCLCSRITVCCGKCSDPLNLKQLWLKFSQETWSLWRTIVPKLVPTFLIPCLCKIIVKSSSVSVSIRWIQSQMNNNLTLFFSSPVCHYLFNKDAKISSQKKSSFFMEARLKLATLDLNKARDLWNDDLQQCFSFLALTYHCPTCFRCLSASAHPAQMKGSLTDLWRPWNQENEVSHLFESGVLVHNTQNMQGSGSWGPGLRNTVIGAHETKLELLGLKQNMERPLW